MDIETRKRIRAYKRALPQLRERVVAVALLLAMSASMLASASFAWLTISRRPEVTGVSTTVAANGNLEIALATGTTTAPVKPNESAVGDSSAAQDVTKANITWGNLVNLSDPSYGLDNLTLRPAQLNRSSLLINPLFGAEYTSDGRVEKLNSNFGFATWKEEEGNWRFFVSNDIGVRAISSTKFEAVGFAQQVYEKRGDAETANLTAGSSYLAITQNKEWMDSLAVIMGTFMTAKMNAGQGDESLTNPSMDAKDVQNLTNIFDAFLGVYDQQFEAMAKLTNYQIFLKNSSGVGSNLSEKTAADMKATKEATLRAEGLQVTGLDKANEDYPKLVDGYQKLLALCNQGSVKWSDSGLDKIVNSLMNVGTCTLDGTPINNIGVSNATGYLDGKTHNAVLTNGVLFNFEKMNGTRCRVENLSVSAKVKRMGITIPATISANITTNAPTPAQFITDLEYADSLNQGTEKGKEVAQDTYGLALDLWVRTNAADSYLTLEGNVLTKSEWVQATGTDRNGETRDIYTLQRKIEVEAEDGTTSTEDIELDLYLIESEDSDGNKVETWYNAASHSTVTLEDGETPTLKMVEVVTVIGFEGENRIWEDANAWEENSQLSLDSTTQGSGSCYVYYADSPEDQARSLELLDAMNVAFVDDEGVLMATAEMDTQRYYAENGRVTVPLVLQSGSLEIGTDNDGNSIYAITPLEQNVPKRITAIVYLDGTKLGNENVLSASDIQGKLNIQFGSSELLSHAKDETLLNATRSVSASVSQSAFKYDESLASGQPMTTTVTVNVDGDAPSTVTAFFIRAISSTQGSREEVMTFTSTDGGATWTSDFTFTAPGNYVLRSVDLDGQTYDLASPVPVTVEGFTVKSLSQHEGKHASIMTAASSFSTNLSLQFASSDPKAMPGTVQGRYLRQDGTAVNVNFIYNATSNTWEGKANFISSGDYTLQYLVLDGEYTELDESMWQSATVYLGMKVAVYTDSPTQFKFVPDELEDNQKNLYMKVRIMDNTGVEMQGLQDARLYYAMQGSSVNGFDTQLTWNGASGYYEGTFKANVGVYYFSNVMVGGNTITYAETSPTFRIQSPEPPGYVGFTPLAYRYNPSGNTDMQVTLTYSPTATVVADIRNLGDNKVYEVQGVLTTDKDNQQTWNFRIPITADGKQDGNWQLETVKVWNYYDAAGNYIKADVDENGNLIADGERDEPLEFSIDGHVTKAVTSVEVTVNKPTDYDHHLGNSATSGSDVTIATATAAFLDTQTITVPTVTIVDFEGQPVGITKEDGTFQSYVSGVKFIYDYNGGSDVHGGYTSANVMATVGVATANLVDTGDHKTFRQSDAAVTVTYAGTYTPKLSYTIQNTPYSKTAAEMGQTSPTIEVWSKAPTATISAISPSGSNPAKITYTTKNIAWYLGGGTQPTFTATGNQTSTYNAETNTATLYAVATADNSTQRHGGFTQPTLTLTVAGVDSGCTVTLTLPGGSADAVTFTRTGNGTIKNTLGKVSQIKSWTSNTFLTHTLNAYYGHGSQTITTMTVVKDGVTFTVTLPKPIVINNPNSVNQ